MIVGTKAFPWGKVAERKRGRMRVVPAVKEQLCKSAKADPHQSKIKDFCQLPPGEALCAAEKEKDI